MKQETSVVSPSWLLSVRLTTYIIISGIVIFGLHYPRFLSGFFLAYSLLTLTLPALLVLRKWFRVPILHKLLPVLQTVSEIFVVIGIVYTTGNVNSAFSGLFILTIISAALVSNLAGTLGVASLVSLAYAFIIWIGLGVNNIPGSSIRALETIFSSQDAAFYSIFLHILTYFLVAFISGFLVERLKARDRQLADTSQALRQAKLETDDILRHLNSGLLTVDQSGRIVYFNRAGEEILGIRESDIRGRDYRDVFESKMPRLAVNLEQALMSRKQTQRDEIEIISRTGEVMPVGLSTSLLLDERDGIRGVIAIFQDLTETKKMEEKMRAADKLAAVGELSAAIAHEIRNPLAAISGSVEVLRGELDVIDDNRRLMELIVTETIRLNKILSDFLLYARSNRAAYNRVELCRLISDVIEVVRHHGAFRDNIDIHFSASDACLYVFGDEDQIKQILINLMVNACEAFEDRPGTVDIEAGMKAGGRIRLRLADNGPGFDKDILPRVFNPFFSTKKDGTGLGLAIVQRLASNMKIDLTLKALAPMGTAFILDFNQVPADQLSQVETRPADAAADRI